MSNLTGAESKRLKMFSKEIIVQSVLGLKVELFMAEHNLEHRPKIEAFYITAVNLEHAQLRAKEMDAHILSHTANVYK